MTTGTKLDIIGVLQAEKKQFLTTEGMQFVVLSNFTAQRAEERGNNIVAEGLR